MSGDAFKTLPGAQGCAEGGSGGGVRVLLGLSLRGVTRALLAAGLDGVRLEQWQSSHTSAQSRTRAGASPCTGWGHLWALPVTSHGTSSI